MQTLNQTEFSSPGYGETIQRSKHAWNIAMFRRDLIEAVELAQRTSGETAWETGRMREVIKSQHAHLQGKLTRGHKLHQSALAYYPTPPSLTTFRRWQKRFNEANRSLTSLLPDSVTAEPDFEDPARNGGAVEFAYRDTDTTEQSVLFAEDHGRQYFLHRRLTKLQVHTLYKAAIEYANLGRMARKQAKLQVFGYRKFASLTDNLLGIEGK